jgi:two-component system, OmpR family, KDP operon response regulator KdpE
MSGSRILVVDDEPQILRALKTNLSAAGYDVETAATGEEALAIAATNPPDALILDLVLPDRTGTDITRELRTWTSVPIVVLSAVGDESEKVEALDAGADDYVTKPFGMDELLARLRASLRRSGPPNGPVIELGMLTLDLEKKALFVNGKLVALTPHEFDLLTLLATNEGKLLTHRAILRRSCEM